MTIFIYLYVLFRQSNNDYKKLKLSPLIMIKTGEKQPSVWKYKS